jgi:hypothetical protein
MIIQDSSDESNRDVISAMLSAAQAGISVIPIDHTTKRPHMALLPTGEDGGPTWAPFQESVADDAQLKAWARSGLEAFAAVCGAVSGGLEILDFDEPGFYEAWSDRVGELANGLVVQRTGGGGYQVLYRCPEPGGNQKLAWVPASSETTGRRIAIETRGQGGYAVMAPSLHPEGTRYEWISGSLEAVPMISQARRDALLAAARQLDQAPKARQQIEAEARQSTTYRASLNGQGGVIDAYNARYSIEAVLERNGYTAKGKGFARPGGEHNSVTVRDGRSFHHNTNDPLNDGYWHDAFDVFCRLEHGGDYRSAVREAAKLLGLSNDNSSEKSSGTGHAPASDEEDGLPWIFAGRAEVRLLTEDAWTALQRANRRRPRFFRRGIPVRLERGDKGELVVKELDEQRVRHELRRVARWYKTSTNELTGEITRRIVDVPANVASDLLATPNPPLPILERIVTVPFFDRNGELHSDPGYSSSSRCYYEPARGLDVPEVPEAPTPEDVERAKALILEELLGDFAFVGDGDKAHAVGLILLPFVRDMIDGPTPNHMITAPSPGSGKGLLCEVTVGVGDSTPRMIAEARDDDEWRKRITAALLGGHGTLVIDNVRNTLDSGALAMALTVRIWTDRILGRSETISLPVRNTWVTTANNPTTSTEIARRSVRIRLDTKMDRPWLRDGFKHENLREWAHEHRGELVWAALTLVRAWIAAGRPKFKGRRLGSYEAWSEVIGGILQTAEIPGFLDNLLDFYHEADREGDKWRQLVELWWGKHGSAAVTSADLYPLAQRIDGFDFGDGSPRSMKIRFGLELAAQRDRVIGEYRIAEAGTKQRATVWRLHRLVPDGPDGGQRVNVVNVSECLNPQGFEPENFRGGAETYTDIHNIHSAPPPPPPPPFDDVPTEAEPAPSNRGPSGTGPAPASDNGTAPREVFEL